jgi:undecaprenyl-phosphate 4-deoxy-4-formamido-L-arabinose transferase
MHPDRILSVVIPVYGSEAYLARTVTELVSVLASHTAFEIVLVNDGSPDNAQREIDRLCSSDSRIRALALGKNVGQHRATLLGLREARGDIAVTLDDDGQNPPSAALAVAEKLRRDDLDVVYGKFSITGQSLGRRLASRLNQWLSKHTLPNESGVALSNVRALRGDLARHLGALASSYPYIDAMIFRMTRHIGEVDVEHRPREVGTSHYTLRKLVVLWLSHITSLSVLPLRVAMIVSFGVSALGFFGGLVAIIRALSLGGAPVGWMSLFCAITFLFSVLFAFLGIVSAYLGRMYVSLNEQGLVWVRYRSPPSPAPAMPSHS